MSTAISILLVDDHAMVRSALKKVLDDQPDMNVVASVGTADNAISEAVRLKPDIVLMDIDMPGMLCFDAAKEIRSLSPHTRIVFLSAFYHDHYIEQAMAVEAWGFITKHESEAAVVQAIRDVASNCAYFSPDVKARLVVDRQGVRMTHKLRSRASTLSRRELEVLQYLTRGMSKKEIARTMHISENTVHRHTTSLMTKLDIHDRVELARFAIREGLVDA